MPLIPSIDVSDDVAFNEALGSVVKAMTVPYAATGLSFTLADAVLNFSAIRLPKSALITGVKFYQVIQGSYTADQYNGIGLYTYVNGVLTLVASSTNDGNIWKGAAGSIQTKAFTTAYQAAAGVYFVGYLYNQSAQVTAPTIGSAAALVSAAFASLDYTNSGKLSASLAAQTTMATPLNSSALTAAVPMPWLALY